MDKIRLVLMEPGGLGNGGRESLTLTSIFCPELCDFLTMHHRAQYHQIGNRAMVQWTGAGEEK